MCWITNDSRFPWVSDYSEPYVSTRDDEQGFFDRMISPPVLTQEQWKSMRTQKIEKPKFIDPLRYC